MLSFGGCNRFFFAGKDTCRTCFAINTVFVDHGRVDGCRFDDRAIWTNIADGETNGARQTHRLGFAWRQDHVVWIDSILSY